MSPRVGEWILRILVILVSGFPIPAAANTADDDFRYGKVMAPYVMGGYSMDWLRQSRCGYLVRPRQYMSEAISDVERGIPLRLEANSKRTFTQIKKLLGVGGAAQFNFEDPKRQELKGNTTSAILSKEEHFGAAWFGFDESRQDAIVQQLVTEENEAKLIRWLQSETDLDERRAEIIANVGLPEGYGSLSAKALARILPELRRGVVTYDKAVQAAGFDHHSHISHAATGEILAALPYYGEYLQRHVGFGTGNPEDVPEKRYGKIANPTVHIGLNQVRKVVNALIDRYGHPSEVIVELARDLKQSKDQRDEESKRQAENQKRNLRMRDDIPESSRGV